MWHRVRTDLKELSPEPSELIVYWYRSPRKSNVPRFSGPSSPTAYRLWILLQTFTGIFQPSSTDIGWFAQLLLLDIDIMLVSLSSWIAPIPSKRTLAVRAGLELDYFHAYRQSEDD